ncbi:BglG family transcription antiterminator [Clostridium sp. LBM24168]
MYSISEFTARQKFIVNAILEKNSLGMNELSRQFNVSSRTILREVNAINKILRHSSVSIYDNNSNLSIMGKKEDIYYIKDSLGDIPTQWLMNQEQRLVLITTQLLLTDEFYKLAFFSYQLNVTESTISLYMDKIKRWLRVRYIRLIRKRGYGITTDGPEWIKRNSFLELIYELKSIDELCSYIYGNREDAIADAFFRILFGEKLLLIARRIVKIYEKTGMNMDDITYLNSLIYVLISLKKAELGYSIKLPSYLIQDVLSSDRFEFIYHIKEYLTSINLLLGDSELTYIAIHLLGDKYIYKRNRKFEEFGVSFEQISRELVYEVERKLDSKIKCDEQLIAGLSQHINSALYRINMDMPVKNTILDGIKEYYNNLFEVVSYSCKLIFSKYNIVMSQDEIGFITMHIGSAMERANSLNNKFSILIICPNGVGTAKMLFGKLKAVIHNIKSITIKSFKDCIHDDERYDIVISTVNIDFKGKLKLDNVIVVSPFLKKDDIDNINNYIDRLIRKNNTFDKRGLSDKKSVQQNEKCKIINNLVNGIRVENIETGSFKELIRLISEDVYGCDVISDSKEIEKLIIAREKLGNVVIPNSHMALLHTRSDCVLRPFMGVYRMRKHVRLRSIGFDYEDVDTFIVLLAKKKEHPYILEQMGKISMSLIEEKNISRILRKDDIKNLRIEMNKILDREDI